MLGLTFLLMYEWFWTPIIIMLPCLAESWRDVLLQNATPFQVPSSNRLMQQNRWQLGNSGKKEEKEIGPEELNV